MNYNLTLKTAPTTEPVTLAEIKAHSVVDFGDDDALLDMYARAARQQVENDTGLCLIDQTWLQLHESFEGEIALYKSPKAAVQSLKYIDTNGAEQTLATDQYTVGERFGLARVCPSYGNSWPSIRKGLGAVSIEYTAGYGADGNAVPAPIKQAIMVMTEHLYENRGIATPVALTEIPASYDALISPYQRKALL